MSTGTRKDAQLWENMPTSLSKLQREDPIQSIRSLSNWDTLYEMRIKLHDVFMSAMYSSHWKDDNPDQKGTWMWFFDEIMDLLELSYLIDEMLIKGEITYIIKPNTPTNNG